MEDDSTNNMSTIVKDMLRNYYNLDDSSKFDLNRAVEHFVQRGIFSVQELIVLRLTMEGTCARDTAKAINKTAASVNHVLTRLSNEIADYLGDDYKDEKILKEVSNRLSRPLTKEEELFCWKVIKAGRSLEKGLSIFNFKVGRHGRIVRRDEDKTEG